VGWCQIDQSPAKAIEKVIRPKILEMDAKSCERIIERMNLDKKLIHL
jgi:hypothetical protein